MIYFTDLCKPIEAYVYAKKVHPFASYPAAKHLNASSAIKLAVADIQQKPVSY